MPKILFAGTPPIAVPSLEMCHEHFELEGVLTNPDRQSGRGRKVHFSAVKEKALELDLPVFQPADLTDEELLSFIRDRGIDMMVVVAYGKIFKQEFLDLFPKGAINLHPSLLPKYRGPSPLTAAILAGDPYWGISIQKLVRKMDAGPILIQRSYSLEKNDTTKSLTEKASVLGAGLVTEAIEKWFNSEITPELQDESRATYCHLLQKEDGKVNWEEKASLISRKIRAYDPFPGTFTFWKGNMLKIHKTDTELYDIEGMEENTPGTVLALDKERGFLVQTGEGILIITELQAQGKKSLLFKDFANGNPDFVGSLLGG